MVSRIFGQGTGLTPGGNDPFSMLRREVDRVFDEVFRGFPPLGRAGSTAGSFTPSLDVRQTDQGLEISAELPGMSEEDVDLRLEGDLLTLAGEKREERRQEEGSLHLTERSFGRFQRSFRLPFRPDPGQVRAEFDRGILRITLPQPQQAQGGGRIPIQPGGRQQQVGTSGGTPAGSAGDGSGEAAQGSAASNDPGAGGRGQVA